RWARGTAAHRLVQRPDDPDLGGAAARRGARGGAGDRGGGRRARRQPGDGRAAGMTRLQQILAVSAGGTSLVAALLAFSGGGAGLAMLVFLVVGALSLLRFRLAWPLWLDGGLAALGATALVLALPDHAIEPVWFWLALAAAWLFAWLFAERLSLAIREGRLPGRVFGVLIPVMFGLALLLVWEIVTRGAN